MLVNATRWCGDRDASGTASRGRGLEVLARSSHLGRDRLRARGVPNVVAAPTIGCVTFVGRGASRGGTSRAVRASRARCSGASLAITAHLISGCGVSNQPGAPASIPLTNQVTSVDGRPLGLRWLDDDMVVLRTLPNYQGGGELLESEWIYLADPAAGSTELVDFDGSLACDDERDPPVWDVQRSRDGTVLTWSRCAREDPRITEFDMDSLFADGRVRTEAGPVDEDGVGRHAG